MLKAQPVFFLMLITKRERKNNLQKELLSKKEQRLDNLGNSQSVHITKKIAKIRTFTVRKACSGEKAKGVAGHPLTSILKDQSIQSLKTN